MQTESWLRSYQEQARPLVQKFFAKWQAKATHVGQLPKGLIERYATLYPKGKQHRGALMVLGYELAGGKNKTDILQASLLAELFQTAILIADDIFDEDDLRRGSPTIHRQWEKVFVIKDRGKREAQGRNLAFTTTIIGLYLAPLALQDSHFSERIKQKALEYFFTQNIYLGWGEALDISTPHQSFGEKKDAAQMIHDYKAVGYSAVNPLHLGALLTGVKNKVWFANLDRYGICLGRIFQIQDDIIGSFGHPEETGKAADSDIRQARWTILTEILWEKANKKDRKLLKRLFEKPERNNQDVVRIKSLMQRYKVAELARAKARSYLVEGEKLIPQIAKNSEHQEILTNLLKFMLERTK